MMPYKDFRAGELVKYWDGFDIRDVLVLVLTEPTEDDEAFWDFEGLFPDGQTGWVPVERCERAGHPIKRCEHEK